MTLNIICVKWGDLYSDEYVENLYRGCYDKFSYDFKFFCVSDNTSPIKGIEIRDPVGKSWNTDVPMFEAEKMHYFSEDYLGVDGYLLALDLDMIILDDIYLEQYKDPTIIYKYWRTPEWFSRRKGEDRTMLNSSMLYWKQNSMTDYFKKYIQDEDYWLYKYPTDNYHQFADHSFQWSYFDKMTVYSYDQGATYEPADGKTYVDWPNGPRAKYRPGYTACIFNGESPMIHMCDNWVKDYWSS